MSSFSSLMEFIYKALASLGSSVAFMYDTLSLGRFIWWIIGPIIVVGMLGTYVCFVVENIKHKYKDPNRVKDSKERS